MNAVSKTKRSRTQIEKNIARCAESIQKNGIEIGNDLIEIRDRGLWSDGYDSWNKYLKDHASTLVGRTHVAAMKLIQCAAIVQKMPSSISDYTTDLSPTHVRELGRLAPDAGTGASRKGGSSKDYTKIRKQDVARVIKNAGPSPSSRDLKRAVDEELGIDREKLRRDNASKLQKAADENRKRRDADNELGRVIAHLINQLEDTLSDFNDVPDAGWEWLEDHKPGLCQELARVCDELAVFMRG